MKDEIERLRDAIQRARTVAHEREMTDPICALNHFEVEGWLEELLYIKLAKSQLVD